MTTTEHVNLNDEVFNIIAWVDVKNNTLFAFYFIFITVKIPFFGLYQRIATHDY